jgi:hypothetical protein
MSALVHPDRQSFRMKHRMNLIDERPCLLPRPAAVYPENHHFGYISLRGSLSGSLSAKSNYSPEMPHLADVVTLIFL